RGKQVILVTNAHYKTLQIKMRKTRLGGYFDKVITSFEIGTPKENLPFWERTQKIIGFDKDKTLFVDDTLEILKTAREFGIKYILYKRGANSKERNKKEEATGFLSIADFNELLL
ncbi:MAG: HAD-IA family hydrolase, partial [Nitrospirae bacterium]|nr:HAD-IA family hydrolase [Nitrospirota bacterium]